MKTNPVRYRLKLIHRDRIADLLGHGVSLITSQVAYEDTLDWFECDVYRDDVAEEVEKLGGIAVTPQ